MLSIGALEEAVLTLLCYSKEDAPLLALKVTPNNFVTRVNQNIAKAALDYISHYKQPPGVQLEYLLEQELRRGEEGKLMQQTLDILKEQADKIQSKYVLDQLDLFIQVQNYTNTLQQAMEFLAQGQLDKAKEIIHKIPLEMDEKGGIWLTDAKSMLAFLNEEESDFYSSGVQVLDRLKARPKKKCLIFMIAPSKFGKSWWMVEMGKHNLLYRHKILHITLELSQQEIAKRYIQSIFSLSEDDAVEISGTYFRQSEKGTEVDIQSFLREGIAAKKTEVEKRLRAMITFPKLLIKEFPTGTLSSEYLSLYLESLEKQKFIPDLVLLDYADLMQVDAKSLRIDLGRLYKDLRGIAGIRNLAMVTASQGNRDSDTAKTVDRKNVAEDWSKIGTADMVLTMSRTEEERRIGLARLFVAGSRICEDRKMVLISQAYPIGQFCLSSTMMTTELGNRFNLNDTTKVKRVEHESK